MTKQGVFTQNFAFSTFLVKNLDRDLDAENNIFENLRLDLLLKLAQGILRGDETLNFLLYTQNEPCTSCLAAAIQFILWFRMMFPNLKINFKINFDEIYDPWQVPPEKILKLIGIDAKNFVTRKAFYDWLEENNLPITVQHNDR